MKNVEKIKKLKNWKKLKKLKIFLKKLKSWKIEKIDEKLKKNWRKSSKILKKMKIFTKLANLSLLLTCFIINFDESTAQSSVCFCVTSGYCTSNPTVAPNDGSNQIDIRIVNVRIYVDLWV